MAYMAADDDTVWTDGRDSPYTSHASVDPEASPLPADALRSAVRLGLGLTGLAILALRELLEASTGTGAGPRQVDARDAAVPPPTQTLLRVAVGTAGLAVEGQRRFFNAAASIGGPVVTTMSAVLELASARGPGAGIARRLESLSESGLAEQRRNQQITFATGQAVVRAVVDAVLAEVDLDAVVARVDLDAAVARVDIDAIVDRLDLDLIAARLDLDAIAARLDVDAVVDRVDLQRLTADVLAMVDVDAIAARLDLDAVAARLDVNAVVNRVDLASITEQVLDEVDVGLIVRESSGAMAAETVDAVRIQGMRADRFLSRIVDRLLLRAEGRDTSPPASLPLLP
jgi:hypothetical protein